MTSLYIHIPFCKKACHYCNFYFTLSTSQKDKFIKAICREIESRKEEVTSGEITTIYFGGGTPSLLSITDFELILNSISKTFRLAKEIEISTETNPENLNLDYLKSLKSLDFNRISIGIQSFVDKDLSTMNRNHNADLSKIAIRNACQVFDNVSIDLMFGLPYSGMNNWQENLKIATDFDIKHISTYNLTIEEKTALASKIKRNELSVEPDSILNDMYFYTLDFLESKNFINYEISNFGKENYWSNHNLNYWNGTSYLGFGPSAHSYDGKVRRSNCSNLNQYLAKLNSKESFFEFETLSPENSYNEYVLTRLRTIYGIDSSDLNSKFNAQFQTQFYLKIENFISQNLIKKNDQIYTLTKEGKVLADYISSELMLD